MGKEIIGNHTLYLGDCLEVMQCEFSETEKIFEITITDPPYGIKADKGFSGAVGFAGSGEKIKRRNYEDNWDAVRPEKKVFDLILKSSKLSLIFGGNYFSDILPPSTHWLVWDKMQTMPTFSDCELIYTNSSRKSVMKYVVEWNGLMGKEKERFHPTQKPVELIFNLLQDYSKNQTDTVFDPFMGSGTTGVACEKYNRRFVGVEKEGKYFDIACKRIEAEYRQQKLF